MKAKEYADKNIRWLGHDGFVIRGSRTVVFDPFQIEDGPTADVVLITHDHYDHCSPEDVQKVSGEHTVIVTEKDSAKKLSGDVRVLSPGETLSVGEIKIEAVAAYNQNKQFHPKENEWLGFIVEMDGMRIYHAGDTDLIPEMKGMAVNIALLPVSGTYVMTAEEAVEAALDVAPDVAIPMHFGAIVGDRSDAETFRDRLKGKVEVLMPKADA